MKRQQLARKESIALYELEANRIKNLNLINKKSELRSDGMWGEYGARAFYQKQGLPFIGEFESQYEQYEGSTGEIRHLKEDTLENGGIVTQNQNAVGMWYDSHTQQLGQIEAFAPQLQELYDTESKLIEKYGSQEEARNSKEFKEAVQQFADATGLNETTAKKYLDYLQTEANVENARKVMQVRVDAIVAEANAEAMKALYGDETGMGDLNVLQDSMVYATADEIFKDAYNDLYWKMLMEWLSAIWNAITLNFGESNKHAKAAGAYQKGMDELTRQQKDIIKEGVDAANENERKDYGNESYSYYDDTPFGGAQASSQAMKEDWATENEYDTTTPSPFAAQRIRQANQQSSHQVGKSIFESLSTRKNDVFDKFAQVYDKKMGDVKVDNSKTEIHIHNLNINTEDDPEKIKTAFMELIVEMGDQLVPRQVSRTVGGTEITGTQETATNESNTNDDNANTTNNNNANPN